MKRANRTTPIASMAISIIRKSPLGLSRGTCPPSTHGRQAKGHSLRKTDLDREDRNTSHQGSRAPAGVAHKEFIVPLLGTPAAGAKGPSRKGLSEHKGTPFSFLVGLGPVRSPALQVYNRSQSCSLARQLGAVFQKCDADCRLARPVVPGPAPCLIRRRRGAGAGDCRGYLSTMPYRGAKDRRPIDKCGKQVSSLLVLVQTSHRLTNKT